MSSSFDGWDIVIGVFLGIMITLIAKLMHTVWTLAAAKLPERGTEVKAYPVVYSLALISGEQRESAKEILDRLNGLHLQPPRVALKALHEVRGSAIAQVTYAAHQSDGLPLSLLFELSDGWYHVFLYIEKLGTDPTGAINATARDAILYWTEQARITYLPHTTRDNLLRVVNSLCTRISRDLVTT